MKPGLFHRFGRLHQPRCRCGESACGGAAGCSGHDLCATREWSPAGPMPAVPRGLTLRSLGPGQRARIEDLSLPEAVKKRLWSLGLTRGTIVTVVTKEAGRMIIAVRDSRLGLGPETAARILCRQASRSRRI